jgi:hypothetical protein
MTQCRTVRIGVLTVDVRSEVERDVYGHALYTARRSTLSIASRSIASKSTSALVGLPPGGS